MVETWINIEYDVDVIDTIVSEHIYDIEEKFKIGTFLPI